VKAATAHLPNSPSKTLVRFANQIASFDKALVVDAPCGYGRNAVALAARGCTVIAIDKNRKRLAVLDELKASSVAERTPVGVSSGQILTVCADLTADGWPIARSSVSAIICVHYVMIDLIPTLISSLQEGGYLYIETFGGQGENFRELPKAKQLSELLSRHTDFHYYKERKVGPADADSVAVTLFAQRRSECSWGNQD
jgi:SAM-dependent methyltransferase